MKIKQLLLVTIMSFSLCSCRRKEKYYTVIWLNYDQSVLEVDRKVK